MFDKIIEHNKTDMLHSVQKLIEFKSISIETNEANQPFGEACKKALHYTLELAKKLGFQTKNLDEYCGYIEFGEGKELVGILGHLDVVPANIKDGWKTNPFKATIRNNRIYGRGAIDDKGPVIAALYAMKAVLDSGQTLNKRVRLILGLNEEKSWKCIAHYKAIGEEIPTIGFSPDADFPCIYAEKGILSLRLSHPFSIPHMTILNIDCENNALNVVPKYCSITLKYQSKQNRTSFKPTEQITVETINQDTLKLTAHGIAAHAAHPELGENAITLLIHYLNQHIPSSFVQNELTFLKQCEELGLFQITSPDFLSPSPLQDESGILTSNVGFLDWKNEALEIGFNLRVPIHTPLHEIIEKYTALSEIFPALTIQPTAKQDALYVPKNSKLITTLSQIFHQKTGLLAEPIAIGGGTYARAFPNCVAFGANMPGKKDLCHQANEFIAIDDLILSSKIYASAIYALAK